MPGSSETALIKSFANEVAFESWMRVNHDRKSGVWLKIHKKDSGLRTITPAGAIDVALCWGWIDGIRKGFDGRSYLQRFTPRRARSVWSQINRENVARLVAAGRMTEHGQRVIDAAKADGRWDAAYASQRRLGASDLPRDLREAIFANPRAGRALAGINRADLFSMVYRTNKMKTPAGRARQIATLVGKLARGEAIAPQRRQFAKSDDNREPTNGRGFGRRT